MSEPKTATGVMTAELAARPAQPSIPDAVECPREPGHYYDEWWACDTHNVLVPREWAEDAARALEAASIFRPEPVDVVCGHPVRLSGFEPETKTETSGVLICFGCERDRLKAELALAREVVGRQESFVAAYDAWAAGKTDNMFHAREALEMKP